MKTEPESRNNGAVLVVFLLGLALVLYIFSISPADRANLLEDDEIDSYNFKEESIGYIYPDDRTYIHQIAPVNIQVKSQSEQIFSYQNITIKQSIFYKEELNLNTTMLKNYNYLNLLITFNEKIGPETAYLLINNNRIEFPNNLPVKNIIIPEEIIQNSDKITIKLKFKNDFLNIFTKEEYIIESISLVGNILDDNTKTSTKTFTLKPQEEKFLDSSIMTFVVSCNKDSILNVKLNDFTILNEKLECTTSEKCVTYNGSTKCIDEPLEKPYSINLKNHEFKYGKNEVTFSLLEGNANINKIEITNKLIPIPIKTFEFKLTDRILYNKDTSKNYTIYLESKIQNVESGRNYDFEFDLYINGYKIRTSTRTGILIEDITKYVTKNNIIWIDTDDTLHVEYMKSYFE